MWLLSQRLCACVLLFTIICGELTEAASKYRRPKKRERKCGYDVSVVLNLCTNRNGTNIILFKIHALCMHDIFDLVKVILSVCFQSQ